MRQLEGKTLAAASGVAKGGLPDTKKHDKARSGDTPALLTAPRTYNPDKDAVPDKKEKKEKKKDKKDKEDDGEKKKKKKAEDEAGDEEDKPKKKKKKEEDGGSEKKKKKKDKE